MDKKLYYHGRSSAILSILSTVKSENKYLLFFILQLSWTLANNTSLNMCVLNRTTDNIS